MFRRCTLVLLLLYPALQAGGQDKAVKPRTLPGVEADGAIRLPNTWTVKPVGKQIELGDLPVNIALHPGGKWLAVLHAGYGDHEIALVDLEAKKERVRSRVILEQTFIGLAFSPDGKKLFASGGEFDVVHMFDFQDGFLTNQRKLPIPPPTSKTEKSRVLLVRAPAAKDNDVDYIGHALAPLPSEKLTLKKVARLDPMEKLTDFHVVILANVGDVDERQVRDLAEFVRNGGGLLVFPGDNTRPEEFNKHFRADNEPILPAELGTPVRFPKGQRIVAVDHPMSQGIRNLRLPLLDNVQVFRNFKMKLTKEGRASFQLVSGEVLVAERSFGKGKVVLFGSGADREWSDIVLSPVYVPWIQNAVAFVQVPESKFIPGGLAVHPDGETIYAAGVWGHGVCIMTFDQKPVIVPLGQDSFPNSCLVDAKGRRLYVSLWNRAAVAVIDLDNRKVVQTLRTEKHPTEMVFGAGGKALFVACANSTRVSVLSLPDGKGLETINCALYASVPAGNTPNSLSMTPDGQLLFVANADNNNIAMFNVSKPGDAKPLGFIPTGIYPTSVRYNPADKRLYIANGRGSSPRANPQGPNPELPKNTTVRQYIAGLYRGTLGIVELPDAEKMIQYSKQAYQCSPLRGDLGVVGAVPKDSPIPAAPKPTDGRSWASSPIKYCIYVIRENRTYDQVFGDMKEGNGAPHLCIFPEKITPNAHRLARQFVLLDNFYCDGEVSADGHEWSMGAYCTDWVKRVWPLSYRGSPTKKLAIYPSEGMFDEMSRPAGGYIWDRCADARISYRSYGEWISNGKTLKDPGKARVKALEGHFDPWFHGYDLDYADVKRADRFIEELHRFEKEGGMPQLTILRLPNDHTYGTKEGKPTPTAMVADNDLALGRCVEAISKSKFWKETAIFVIEDDAQNGSDHVDAHRTVALCISPYTQHGKVDSTMYSTSSMLRTMELILGLKPMSQFDAAARPMFNAFRSKPNFAPYTHVVPDTDMKALNLAGAWGSKMCESFDFTKEDAIDDLIFNEVIWRSVRGANSPMPPPVRSAFVFPHLPKE